MPISEFLGHKEKIEGVEKININEHFISLYAKKIGTKGKEKYKITEDIPKEGWRLFLRGIEIQTSPNTLIILKEAVGCIIDKDRKRIFCGKPEEIISYLRRY